MIGEPLRSVDLRTLRCQKRATFTPAESGESTRGDDSAFPQLGTAAWIFRRIDNFVVIRNTNLSPCHLLADKFAGRIAEVVQIFPYVVRQG